MIRVHAQDGDPIAIARSERAQRGGEPRGAVGGFAPPSHPVFADRRGLIGSDLGRAQDRLNKHSNPLSHKSTCLAPPSPRSEEHTSELQSLMRISYAVFCLKKKTQKYKTIMIEKKKLV